MLKVLHLLPRVPLSQAGGDGLLRSVLGLARALAGEGVTSEVLVGRAPDVAGEQAGIDDGVTITAYPWPAAPASVDDVAADSPAALAAGLSAALAALLSRIDGCDLVHAHDPLFGPGLARLAQSLTGTPYVTSAADEDITDSPMCEQLLCANDFGGALIVTSPEVGQRMAALSPQTTVLVLAAESASGTAGQHSAGHYADGGPGGGGTVLGTLGRVADPDLRRAAVRQAGIYQAVAAGRRPVPPVDPDGLIPMALPDITSAEVHAAAGALVSGKLSQGPHVGGFEQEFADWHRAPHAVAVNSAAAALFAVLSCAGITGEVLVPSFTWATTANVVVAAGATPVWVDIEDDTLGIAPEAAAAAITPRTEAVLCVHFAGHPCRVAELKELSRQHGLLLVEDAAEAAGARQNGELVGNFGVGCFSFYGTKNMTTGEGGMVLTDDAGLAARIKTLRGHGMRPVPGSPYPWRKEAVAAGFNFRMPEPLAAVGRRQLARLAEMNARRREIAGQFDTALADLGDRVFPHRELPGFMHVYHMYVVRMRDVALRDEVVVALRRQGVEASVHFDPPVHEHEFYRDKYRQVPEQLRVTGQVARSVITLPLYTTMSQRSVERVTATLGTVLDSVTAR